MKQAHSQDNLWSVEKGRPLVDRSRYLKKQQQLSKWNSLTTISPMDSSLSSMGHKNGLWKVPTTTQSVPLSQPKRMDVPYSPQANSLLFSTFRQPAESQIMSPAHHRYQHQSNVSPSQRPQQVLKKKTVIFHSSVKTSQNNTSPQRLSANLEQKVVDKTSKLPTTDLLEQDVQQLQAKVQRTLEESERLRRLSLELQFQKRLEEYQQNGDEDEDEDDESHSGAERKWLQTVSDVVSNCEMNCEKNATDQQKEGHLSQEDSLKDEIKHEYVGYDKKFSSGDDKSFKTQRAPENLTFKERQRLFSLAMVTTSKVKVS
ncbi:afadin-like isoform X4 [Ctenopharyngodon idella]|nr:afadin-like isoform X4 [Ctenopharyngodon idella]